MQRKLLGIITVDFDATDKTRFIHFAFGKYLEKKWEYDEVVHLLFIDFKNA